MKVTKNIIKVFFTRITCFIFWLVTCPIVLGQANQKKILTPEDYKLWSSLVPDQISENGNWTSYRLLYKYSDTDTLYLQNSVDVDKKIVFPNAVNGKFNAESDFACIAQGSFRSVNLYTQKQFERNRTERFEFTANQRFVALIVKQTDGKFGLEVRSTNGELLLEITNISRYCFDPKLKGVAYCRSDNNSFTMEAVLFEDLHIKMSIIKGHSAPLQNIIWKENSIAFVGAAKENSILYKYDVKRKKLQSLRLSDIGKSSPDMSISDSEYANPILSNDGSYLFFWLKEPHEEDRRIDEKKVEVWNSKDKLLFDFYKFAAYYPSGEKLAVWNLDSNKIIQITDKNLPKAFLNSDYHTAFIFDPVAYEPQSMQSCPYDLFAMDLKNGEKDLVFQKLSPGKSLSISPDGTYLSYAKDEQWWIYNIRKKNHINITSGITASFINQASDTPNDNQYYGLGGWTKNAEIILYDKFDLWLISVDGKSRKRLTNGLETHKTFRIKHFDNEIIYGNTELKKYTVDLRNGFLMSTEDSQTGKTGLSYWNYTSGIKELTWADKKISVTGKAKNKNAYTYMEQDFTSPPRLVLYDGRPREIVKTNRQLSQYYWGRNEKIEYSVNGKKVKGVLFYPANYQKDRQYPMVVYIYEGLFYKLNEYENPTLFSADGFNTTNYTLHDYFVLYPDIVYEFGNLRESVTNSVLAGVDAALGKGNINSEKVGLIGHSFGGYEACLLLTQTDRFAAVVSGSAQTDLVSAYLYVGPLFRRPDFFRTENHQFRIGKSLYEDMSSYLNNSPVLLASNVKTPLLAWTGKEDRHVNALQSMEFYLALRRLGKEHTLLVYPNEEHQISSKENAADLSLRIMKWFDHYLKNGPKEDWMKSNYKR